VHEGTPFYGGCGATRVRKFGCVSAMETLGGGYILQTGREFCRDKGEIRSVIKFTKDAPEVFSAGPEGEEILRFCLLLKKYGEGGAREESRKQTTEGKLKIYIDPAQGAFNGS